MQIRNLKLFLLQQQLLKENKKNPTFFLDKSTRNTKNKTKVWDCEWNVNVASDRDFFFQKRLLIGN